MFAIHVIKSWSNVDKYKGFFLHHFNSPENWTYVRFYIDRKCHSPEMMKTHTFEQFSSWYNEMIETDQAFNFEQGIISIA